MRGRLIYKGLPILILFLTAILTAAAVEFLPETLYFPVIEYATPDNIRFALLKTGELDQSSCESNMRPIIQAIRAGCPLCKVSERCIRGLDAEHRKKLSRAPLPAPSVRTRDGKVTMTISVNDPQQALGICREIEKQGSSQRVDQRLHCFPAFVGR